MRIQAAEIWVVGYFEFGFISTRAINTPIPAQQMIRTHQGPNRTGRANRRTAKKMRHPDGVPNSVTYAALSALRCS
jgi:hypothetical protein